MRTRMTVLVVDDEENAREMLRQMLAYMGHAALLAANGAEAVRLFQSAAPDLILMDVMMPGLDGMAATAAIRALEQERWVPLILLSALTQNGNLQRGLDAGADDYIVKPVNMAELQAKIRAIERVVSLQARLAGQRAQLERHFRQHEEEDRIGSHLMQSLTSMAGLRDDTLRYWSRPMARFSGDLVAAARTPGQVLHVMVADAVGHGLPAALNVLPLADTFYSMTAEGFSLARIVEELNRKLASLLPVDRFVTATLVSIDGYKKEIQLWNGGNPTPLFVTAAGRVSELGALRHLPLGLLKTAADYRPEVLVCAEPGQLALFTDGLCEVQDAAGHYWGSAGIAAALAGPAAGRYEAVLAGFQAQLGERALADDTSFMLVDLPAQAAPPSFTPASVAPATPSGAAAAACGWRVAFRFSARELRTLDTIPFLSSVVEKMEASTRHRRQVFVILSELFNNAVEHGLLLLDSAMKADADGFARYMRERNARLAALEHGSVEVLLERTALDGAPAMLISLKDSGPGFDHGAIDPAATSLPLHAYGRGILLVHSLCHSLHYRGNGNEVLCYYQL